MIPYFVVHAFTDTVFGGNPAGVCPLESWLDERLMQRIAAENRLSETAFFVAAEDGYDLRWFTPAAEVDLCGHATLASASVLFEQLGFEGEAIRFSSRSGPLAVWREGHALVMDFPSRPASPIAPPEALLRGLGRTPSETLQSRDLLAVFASEHEVRSIDPDLDALATLDCTGVIVTAPGEDVDFVSRFFAPRVGVPEDPVTGSAHCTLAPYWSQRLGRTQLAARQVSARGGELACRLAGDRVHVAGHAVLYAKGLLNVE
jgi:predicted PhzF superfamily epimerase YddE/YHI9